jgi:AcrR family transcriptional regulator
MTCGTGTVSRMVDPRVERTRATVLGTAVDLVVEGGPNALTIDAVVARSGVARSTIYRHWATRDELLVDVFDWCAPQLAPPPAELTFPDAVRHFVHDIVDQLSDPKWARLMPALLMLKSYQGTVDEIDQRMKSHQAEVLDDLFRRGRAEGLVPEAIDADRAVAIMVGPLVFALVAGVAPLDAALADAATDSFLAWLAAGASTGSSPTSPTTGRPPSH